MGCRQGSLAGHAEEQERRPLRTKGPEPDGPAHDARPHRRREQDPSAGAERGQDRLSLTQLRAPEQKGFSRRCLRDVLSSGRLATAAQTWAKAEDF